MGIALGIQLIAGRRLSFLDGQHITNVVLLGGCCIAVGIGNKSFHHLAVQGDGILRSCQRIQGVALDLVNTGLRRIDGLLQGNRLGIFCVGQSHSRILRTNGHFLHFHLTSGVHIDFVAFRGFGFFHEVSTTIQASPLTLAVGIGLTDAGADIAGIGGGQSRVVCTGNGSRTCRVTVQSKLCTRQVGSTCGIGLGQANRASALAIGSPVATQVVEGVGTILCGGVYFRLDSVNETSTEELIRTAFLPDSGTMVGAMGTTQHQLTDHGIGRLLHPGASLKALVTCGCRSVSGIQPVLVGTCRVCHVTNGIDTVGTAQVFRCHIRPDDGGDQSIAILGDTQFTEVRVQIVLDCQIAGTQVLQHRGKQRRVCCYSFALGNIRLVPSTVVAAEDDLCQIIFDGLATALLIADNARIGACLTTGIFIVEPVAGETGPGKGTTIADNILRGESIHIGIGIPPGLYDEGVVGDGKGIEDGGHGFTLVLTGAVPGNRLAGLNSFDDIPMGIVAVVAFVITVVNDLHGNTNCDHVTGTVTSSITAAVTTTANFRARATAVIAGRTYREHHRAFIRYLCRFRFLDHRLSSRFRCRFCYRLCFRFRYGFCRNFCCFSRRFFCFYRRFRVRYSHFATIRRRLSFLILCGKCGDRTKRDTGYQQHKDQ